MITTYLNSLAATVRDLIASGKAVHVNKETAAELDLLAGMPWRDHTYKASADIPEVGREVWDDQVTPADLALGWLLASRALTHSVDVNDGLSVRDCAEDHEIDRAAECAELAAISASHVVNGRLALECLGTGNPLRTTEAHDGTREGARAAWKFIHGHMLVEAGSAWERYRRELEAM